jgi:hypothetical protein
MLQTRSRIFAVRLLFIAALLLAGSVGWYLVRNQDQTLQHPGIHPPNLVLINPPKPSARFSSLPKSVTAQPHQGAFGNVAVPILLIKNVDDALDLEAKTAAIATRVSLSRSADGLDCLIYSERGRRALAVEGCSKIGGAPVPAQPWMGNTPGYSSSADAAKAGINSLSIMPSPKGTILFMSTKSGNQRLPFSGDFMSGDYKILLNYRYAIIMKYKPDYSAEVGILIVDTTPLALVGDVDFPSDVHIMAPRFVLDSQTDGLVVMDGDLKWAMVIDLNPLAVKASQSAK